LCEDKFFVDKTIVGLFLLLFFQKTKQITPSYLKTAIAAAEALHSKETTDLHLTGTNERTISSVPHSRCGFIVT